MTHDPSTHSLLWFCLSVALAYCGGQTVRWIKMKLGVQVGLVPGHIVLDGDPAPPPQRGRPPIFGARLLRPNSWMDQDGTWHEGGPRSRPHCARWGPAAPPPPKGAEQPIFWPMCIVGKRLYLSEYHLVRRYASVEATLC